MTESPSPAEAPSRRGMWWLYAALALALLLAATGAVLLLKQPGHTPTASASPPPAVTPLAVIGTTPVTGATNVAPGTSVSVDFSTPLAANSPMPTWSPAIGGTWSSLSADDLQFTAAGPFVPGSSETLTVPGGATGVFGSTGQHMPSSVTVHFSVAQGSTLRLQQLLAELGYMPLTFTPAPTPVSPQEEADPQAGTFSWRWPNQPASLTSLWTPGTFGVITKGAVMRFETVHGLSTTGVAGPQTWAALLQAAAAGSADPQPYGYVLVSKTLPETATVYQNGAVAYTTLVNTGIPTTPTATGTFTVYLRYQVTTMSGTNPTGSHYTDPGIPWVSYFNGGDALHGFIRASYGFPQSLGCVEMPFANAAVVWPMTPIGTLVTVQ